MRNRGLILSLLAVVALLAVVMALPAVGTSEDPSTEGGTSTETETVVTSDITPAVEVTTPPADIATADWTYRYMIPLGIVLAILVVAATTGQYFTNVVRKRYRIVEE